MQTPTPNAQSVAFSGARGLKPTQSTPIETSATPKAFNGAGISCAAKAAPIATSKGADPRESV